MNNHITKQLPLIHAIAQYRTVVMRMQWHPSHEIRKQTAQHDRRTFRLGENGYTIFHSDYIYTKNRESPYQIPLQKLFNHSPLIGIAKTQCAPIGCSLAMGTQGDEELTIIEIAKENGDSKTPTFCHQRMDQILSGQIDQTRGGFRDREVKELMVVPAMASVHCPATTATPDAQLRITCRKSSPLFLLFCIGFLSHGYCTCLFIYFFLMIHKRQKKFPALLVGII